MKIQRLSATIILVLWMAGILIGGQPETAGAVSPNIVISQVYGGGGNSGGIYTNDYIELFNRGTTTVSLAGWSVQYTSATGTGNFGSDTNHMTPLSGSLAPGQYLLIQEAAGTNVIAPLPTPDVTDATPINLSGTGGKVALVNTTTPLGCNGGSTPCSAAALATIVDLVGWDGANFFEGSGPAPGTTNATAILRNNGSCTDTDNNASDFTAGAPNPRNSASPLYCCPGPTPTGVGTATPSAVFPGDTTLLAVTVTPAGCPPSTGLTVTGSLSSIGGLAAQTFFDDGTNGDVTSGDNVFSFLATVAMSTAPGAKTIPITIADSQGRSGNTSIPITTYSQLVAIHDIQGAGHISPLNGQLVSTSAIVTAKLSNGFYMQDPDPDSNDATSEGIFVFTSSTPAVAIGDQVLVTGTVIEFRPGGSSSTNLTTTEISNPGRTVTIVSSGNQLPAPIVIGSGGRIPPAIVIEDDATGDVETSGIFDPANDGIDFYESLEGMLVQVNNAVAVGPTSSFGEIAVIGDNGANAGVRTGRGGIVIRPSDFNPERIILSEGMAALPDVDVGDSFQSAIVGILDYSFGNFKLLVTQTPVSTPGGITQEIATPAPGHQLSVAVFNSENLFPNDPATKFTTQASQIVNNLKSPDLIAIMEVQDNSGPTDDGVVDADVTFEGLITAIQTAGGPTYDYRQINPLNNEDGGQPGGNIRVGFLFRTDRDLSFVDRPGGDSTTTTTVVNGTNGPELSYSPGRIDPANLAFVDSRKPLVGEFTSKGDKVFVIANHFNSRGGDQPLFGHFQPPVLSSEVQRIEQAQVVNNFVGSILALDPDANIIVLGELNDYEFSTPIVTLKGNILSNLIETLPQEERYAYIFEGNSEALDHILVSNRLSKAPFDFRVVHVNSEFFVQASDHEPLLAFMCTDRTAPQVQIDAPKQNSALQDGVTFEATVSDVGEIDKVFFYIREPNGGNGVQIGYEDLPAELSNGKWVYGFNTTVLQDGNYVILAKATDKCGNEGWSQVTAFSIRNWAIVTLLPATPKNKAGRTMPVKFSIRIAANVDPSKPFVYNEELEIRIYKVINTTTKVLLQTSTFGDQSTDYRIDMINELYITNFKTLSQPTTYLVEVWRINKNFMIGSFTFQTVK